MTLKRFYGYKHWTLEEVPRCFNVGKGLSGRPESHRSRNHKWKGIVKRYDLRVEVCIGPVTNEEACAWEIATITEMGTFTTNQHHNDDTDIRCNFTRGGEGVVGRKHDEATKQKIALTMRGKKHTSHARQRMQAAQSKKPIVQYNLKGMIVATYISANEATRQTGIANINMCCRRKVKSSGGFVWRYQGDRFDPKTPAVLSEEHRRKLSEAHVGMKHTVETRQKIGAMQRGRSLSIDHRRNIGKASAAYWAERRDKAT